MPSPQTRRSERGFTLLEVMVALGIMGMVMAVLYGLLDATLKSRDKLEREARAVRVGPDILDLIEADLRRAWVMDIAEDRVFLGESKTIDGEPADALSFLTTVDSTITRLVDEREVPSDVCETGYRLRRNANLPDVRELWRRQSFHVDEKPLEDGVYELLHDRVIAFQVRYFDDVDKHAEERTEWDASVRHRLPALVQIDLTVESVPRTSEDLGRRDSAGRTQHFRRVIAMPPDSDIRMRVHAVTPTYVASGGTAGGGGQDGPDDGKPDDPDNPDGPKDPNGSDNGGDTTNPPPGGDQSLDDALNDLFGGGGGGGGGG